MQDTSMGSTDILRVIQAATAPVVLISGVGLLLLTLTARLGRIVDRTRILAGQRRSAEPAEKRGIEAQLLILGRRARLIRLAVTLSALAVAMTGILIAVLFLGLLLDLQLAWVAAVLFVGSLFSLVAAMLVFVQELFSALTALELNVGEPLG
jgi:Protein of unknown function (DUF2721)